MENKNTRDLILKKANELFLVKGYQNTTIPDICKYCNISKTTFYYHIKSKEEILTVFYDYIVAEVIEKLKNSNVEQRPFDKIQYCFDLFISVSEKYGSDFFSYMFISNLKEDKGSFDLRGNLTTTVVDIIKEAQTTDDILNKEEATTLYVTIAYAFIGLQAIWCIRDGKVNCKEKFNRFLKVILIPKDL
ncbi:MAG: TetR/AcrR family transcriptional regulator [Lachnospirales bacterium]